MKRCDFKQQQNIILRLKRKIKRHVKQDKQSHKKTVQIAGTDIAEMINKLQQQSFMEGYCYAIQLLKDGIRKTK